MCTLCAGGASHKTRAARSRISPARSGRQPAELVTSVRGLDSRLRELEEAIGHEPRRSRKWRREYSPFMLHELSHMLAREPGDPASLLVLASVFRDSMPWLYELGMDAYRTAKTGTRDQTRKAMERFQATRAVSIRCGDEPFIAVPHSASG
jgi:hypothetical protein